MFSETFLVKRNSSPHPGKSNSSHPGPALKAATLEMMKRKEEKDKLKQQEKEERKQLYLKQQAQKEKEETQKVKQAEKQKKMTRRSWTMILWFSQSHLPVITSLKAHFYDYQQLKQWKVSI